MRGSRPFPSIVFTLLALAAALRGQSVLMELGLVVDPLLFFSVTAVFLWLSHRKMPLGDSLSVCFRGSGDVTLPLVSEERARQRLLLGTLVAALLAFLCFGGNRLSSLGLFFGAVSLVLLALAAARRPGRRPREDLVERGRLVLRLSGFSLAVIGLTMVGLWVRFYGLEELPGDMNSSHVEELLEVQGILGGELQVFFQRSFAREPLFLYVTAFLVRATPLSIGFMVLKIASVLLAVLAIPFTCLMGREVFGRAGGVLAGLLLVFSHWHLVASRNGFQQGLAASVSAAFLYFWLRACRRDSRNDWLAAGALAGIGLLSSWNLWPLAFLLVLTPVGEMLLSYRRRLVAGKGKSHESFPLKVATGNVGLGLVATILMANPLIHYAVSNPGRFWKGFASGMQDLSGISWVEILERIFSNVWKALLMFNVRVAPHWVDAVRDLPALGWVTASLFLAGVLMVVAAWRHQKAGWMAVFALPVLIVLLLPVVLNIQTPSSVPSLAVAAGALPLVCVIAAFPLVRLWHLGREFRSLGSVLVCVVLTVLFVQILLDCRNAYFDKYAAHYETRSWNHREVGEVVRGYGDALGVRVEAWVVEYPHWIDYRAVGIESGSDEWPHVVRDLPATELVLDRSSPQLFLLHPDDKATLDHLTALFPSAVVRRHSGRSGKDFVVLYLSASAETRASLENR